ncbi:FAD-dependent monooxygenase [Actinomadura rupiterrae]|uniref:FAD-dependent monooxygenase n=1 Tax=Actinomadura rupiterrae TaxID=559627 RepID=UPI0020A4878B|nr:FAD-dependent monooxygenase [Actinomadura rupiterrae]MCP2343007.1 2-polyprenyl-6-methoxyphenol hydroxylase-like FAD-dependent oxidoreductase [Actinomadura rupiterrae]
MNALPATADVLVAGAGPAGLALTATLRAKGVDAVLVDRLAEGQNTSRAAVVHAKTLEVLRELKVTDDLVSRGVIAPRFTVRERDRVLLTIDFDDLPTDFPYALMVPQNITEELLLARLEALGGSVLRPHELTSLRQDADGVTGVLADGHEIRAKYAVGADGMHSRVREELGIPFEGDTYAESFILADVRLDWDISHHEVMLYFSREGVTVVAPLPDGRHRIVATVAEAPEHPTVEDVQALLDTRGPRRHPARVSDMLWSSRFRVHHRLAARYREGRVFLAGDAAHVHSPAGGQGMNTGIQDAVDLGHRLAAVLADGASPDSLDAYEATRRPIAEEVVSFTDRMTRVATVGNPALRGVRNTFLRTLDWLPPVHRAMAMRISELGTTD